MTLDDKLTRGFIAGMLAGFMQSGVTNTMFNLKKTKTRWRDFASVLIYHDRPQNFSQALCSEVVTLIWSGILGAGYVFAMPRIGERNRRYKGMLYGTAAWFSIYSIVHLFDVDKLIKTDKDTTTMHGIIAGIWGLTMDESLMRLERWTEHNQPDQELSIEARDLYQIADSTKH